MSSTIKRSTSGNFIPTNAEKLVGWGANLLNVVDKYISGWTHIPKQALEDLKQKGNVIQQAPYVIQRMTNVAKQTTNVIKQMTNVAKQTADVVQQTRNFIQQMRR